MSSDSNSGVGAGKPAEAANDKKRAEAGDPPKNDFLQDKRESLADQGLAHADQNAGQPMERKEYSKSEREGDKITHPEDNVPPAVANSDAEKARKGEREGRVDSVRERTRKQREAREQ